jgi:hypothetical protein
LAINLGFRKKKSKAEMEENVEHGLKIYERRADPNDRYYVAKEEFEPVDLKGTKGLKKADGVVLPLWVNSISLPKNMKLNSDDTFVAGYTKAGKLKRF